ncbi:CBU_0592 family membrane protein [Halocola ammonii]
MTYENWVNTAGVFFILLAFFLSTFGIISAKSKIYFIINVIGGGVALYGCILIEAIPFAVLEAVWTLVALIGLIKSLLKPGSTQA